ncbi:uncharacterized protein [Hyperolius riggenbachi]|uniref:uncharacterized protein n=1 Tax=Hyperolius riggenbachi TaxID=752182 RepID=UPI0035A2AB16
MTEDRDRGGAAARRDETLQDSSAMEHVGAMGSNAKACSDCNSTTTANCAAKSGYVSCSCKPGYVGDGLNCTIMEFCDTSPCCPDGYTWDNKQKLCADIDECASPTLNKCSPTDTCVNQNGTYLCNRNRNAPCGRSEDSHCTSEHDCLRISGEAQCADPCYNYQQVNGANRLANMSSTGRFPTDRNLCGWYRYVGTGSSLKEGCVGPLKCGSLEPYTLGGSHPKIGDGIQILPLLINSVASGCYNGPNILVKACSAGHYVYKFSGSLKFDVYCTDPDINIVTTSASTRRLPVVSTATPTTTSTTTTPTTTPTTTTTTPTTTPTTTRTTTPTTTPTTTRTTTPTTTPTTTTTTPTTTSTTTSTTTKADEDTCTKSHNNYNHVSEFVALALLNASGSPTSQAPSCGSPYPTTSHNYNHVSEFIALAILNASGSPTSQAPSCGSPYPTTAHNYNHVSEFVALALLNASGSPTSQTPSCSSPYPTTAHNYNHVSEFVALALLNASGSPTSQAPSCSSPLPPQPIITTM